MKRLYISPLTARHLVVHEGALLALTNEQSFEAESNVPSIDDESDDDEAYTNDDNFSIWDNAPTTTNDADRLI